MSEYLHQHVLVIDDDDDILSFMFDNLRALGCEHIHVAKNGEKALEILQLNKVEMIFTDINMPAMDGIETISMLSKAKYRGGISVLSAQGQGVLRSVMKIAELNGLKCIAAIRKDNLDLEKISLSLKLNKERSSPININMQSTVRIEELETAMARNEFYFVAQPKVAVRSEKWLGVELLIRWKHPQKGEMPPNTFIDALVESHLLSEFNRWVCRESLKASAQLIKKYPGLNVAINFSTPCFAEADFFEELLLQAHTLDLPFQQITLEITERHPFKEGRALEALTRLRLRGFNLAIDDYGVGFSNLEKMYQGPFSELKMDMSFVNLAVQERPARKVLSRCVDIAHDMGMLATAEGVSSQEHWDLVKELGFDCAQGFYIGKPKSCADLGAWSADWTGLVREPL